MATILSADLSFLSADLSFLSPISLVCTARVHTCAQLECTRVRRANAHVCAGRVHTNDSQEKNDKSLEKTIATAGKNENLLPWRKAFDQGDR